MRRRASSPSNSSPTCSSHANPRNGAESHPRSRISLSYKPWRYANRKSISKNCRRSLDNPWNCLWMTEDGIPWHNNTAERAIRPFAIQRDISKSPLYEATTQAYLALLSIRQTCRFQGKSFFKFLFSGETDLEHFDARTHRR